MDLSQHTELLQDADRKIRLNNAAAELIMCSRRYSDALGKLGPEGAMRMSENFVTP